MNNPLIVNLQIILNQLNNKKEIVLCMIHSHIGIKNELVAQNDAISNFRIPYTDIKDDVNIYIVNKNGRITGMNSLTINYIK